MTHKWTTEMRNGAKVHRVAEWLGDPQRLEPQLPGPTNIITRAFVHLRTVGITQFPGMEYLDLLYQEADEATKEVLLEAIAVAYTQCAVDTQQFTEP